MEVVMPKMGESINEGTIIKWHKNKGDRVKRDEIIFEISTDKVDTEVPSPSDGILSDIKVNEGDTVEVGTVVAIIQDNGGPAEPVTTRKQDQIELKKEKEKTVQPQIEKPAVEEQNQKVESAAPAENGTSGATTEILMPKMGESVMEGTILKWHKKKGDQVKKDEIIFEISTDKVDTEIPSPSEGILSEILVNEQETVEVGTVVARLSGGSAPVVQQSEKQVKEDKKDEVQKTTTIKETPSESMHDNFARQSIPEENVERANRFVSPLVLNIARQENVSFEELNRIKGSGLDERITKKDILNYVANRTSSIEPAQQPAKPKEPSFAYSEAPNFSVGAADSSQSIEKIPMDNIRQKIMQHMINSRDTSVHVSAMLEVDMIRIYNFLQKNRDKYQQEGIKLTYMSFIAGAVVKALKQFPLVNSSVEGNTILRKKNINLGIAVALEPNGLIVPNIKNAEEKNILGLAKSINELAQKARTKKLTPDDITGGTFTITNYGVFGLNFGTPIINQPEVAILGVGTVLKKPVVVEYEGTDTIAIKPIMALTISHDHRLIDGMLAGLFLKFIKDTLENFDPGTF